MGRLAGQRKMKGGGPDLVMLKFVFYLFNVWFIPFPGCKIKIRFHLSYFYELGTFYIFIFFVVCFVFRSSQWKYFLKRFSWAC